MKPYSTLFTKIRYAALFGKALLAEGGAILALQQKTHILQIRIGTFKGKTHVSMNVSKPCCSNSRIDAIFRKQHVTCSYRNATISERIQYIHRRVPREIEK